MTTENQYPAPEHQFRKRPIVVEARRLTNESFGDVYRWVDEHDYVREWCWDPCGEPGPERYIDIDTLEGKARASEGDWIIRGIKGELYPCKPDIFEATYEAAATPAPAPAVPAGLEAIGHIDEDGRLYTYDNWTDDLRSVVVYAASKIPSVVAEDVTEDMMMAGARSLIDGQEQRSGTSWADEARLAYLAMRAAAPKASQQATTGIDDLAAELWALSQARHGQGFGHTIDLMAARLREWQAPQQAICACGDTFTAADPGVCVNCVAGQVASAERSGRLEHAGSKPDQETAEQPADLMAAVEQILDAGHMNTEDLGRLRAAWGAPAPSPGMKHANGWRPIETAPTDGTFVLLWLRAPYSVADIMRWDRSVAGWVAREWDPKFEGFCGSLVPSHWMPLPEAPDSDVQVTGSGQ